MAKIELSAEARAIEATIESGEKRDSAGRLLEAEPVLGRRPEYRYLRHLYEHVFELRSPADLLRDVVELAGDQPDLAEATALVAELYEKCGDRDRADLFARVARDSDSRSAQDRAAAVLRRQAESGSRPVARDLTRHLAQDEPTREQASSAAAGGAVATVDEAKLTEWFERARRDLVQRRGQVYGVRAQLSPVDALLDDALAVARGPSAFCEEALPMTRASLALIDEATVRARREKAASAAGRSERAPIHAAAGFFLAVALHELGANALEVAPDDGHCKVVVPSGAGARPLLVSAAFAEGTGPSLVQTYDRLAASVELASMPPGSYAPTTRPPKRPSSNKFRIASIAARIDDPRTAAARTTVPSPALDFTQPVSPRAARSLSSSKPELALTRPEVEAQWLRVLATTHAPSPAPPIDLAAVARAFTDTPFGVQVTARLGTPLSPVPSHVDALETHLSALRGRAGAAPDKAEWHPSDGDEALIVSCGAFLGEVLIATYGGIWESDPNAPSDARLFRVVCQDQVATWPITYLFLRLKNGIGYDLSHFASAVGASLLRP